MNVGFHRGGVGAQPLTAGHGLLLGDLDDSPMDPRGSLLAEKAKGAGETGKIGDGILIEASKAAIKQTGPQFPSNCRKDQPLRCFKVTQRKSRSGAMEGRPKSAERVLRLARASEARSIKARSFNRLSRGSSSSSVIAAASFAKAK